MTEKDSGYSTEGLELVGLDSDKLSHFLLFQHRLQVAYLEEMERHVVNMPEVKRGVNASTISALKSPSVRELLLKVASVGLEKRDSTVISRASVASEAFAHLKPKTQGDRAHTALMALQKFELVGYKDVSKCTTSLSEPTAGASGSTEATVERSTARYDIKPTMKLFRLLDRVFDKAAEPILAGMDSDASCEVEEK